MRYLPSERKRIFAARPYIVVRIVERYGDFIYADNCSAELESALHRRCGERTDIYRHGGTYISAQKVGLLGAVVNGRFIFKFWQLHLCANDLEHNIPGSCA